VFSCSKIEQKQLNTWVSFQSAEQPLLGQFSVSGNSLEILLRLGELRLVRVSASCCRNLKTTSSSHRTKISAVFQCK